MLVSASLPSVTVQAIFTRSDYIHPDRRSEQPGSTGGTYTLDRIAIPNGVGAPLGSGTGARLYNSTGTKSVKCTTEASC